MRRLASRLDKLAARAADATRPGGHRWAAEVADLEARIAFLEHIPPDLRRAVDRRFTDGTDEAFASWRLWPFAPWAPPMPAGFVFPRALVEWMLAPPHPFWLGHHCERCGLAVPLFTACLPNSPPDLRAFPACPACGGTTSHAAHYRPAVGPGGPQ